jgi:hypothetical protein
VLAKDITGVRAFGPTQAGSWMPTRKIWNQFDYNPALVSEKGRATASAAVESNYTSRTFRRNSQLKEIEPVCE